jgi:hypothetical protein
MSQQAQVRIVWDSSDEVATADPVRWASGQLREALAAHGIATDVPGAPAAARVVVIGGPTSTAARVAGDNLPEVAEGLALVSGAHDGVSATFACGSDVRGLVYAILELADRVRCGTDALAALAIERPISERPANQIRGVARLFVSDVEDKAWFYDRDFWQRYLTLLASQRFNRIHLALGIGHDFLVNVTDAYFLYPYPFFVDVPGYDVRSVGLPDEERERNLGALRYISDAAAERGLHFQLGIWTHGYAWTDSPNAASTISGLTPDNHAEYSRDALRTLLEACPSIAGVTLRIHGESGITEGNNDFWKVLYQGVVQTGRAIELDLHPKGVDAPMIATAVATGLPVNISPKFVAEHMGLPAHQMDIRPSEQNADPSDHNPFAARLMNRSAGELRYTRYSYGDFMTEDRRYGVFFRIWPGTQRLLLWGNPALAAGFGRSGSFAGAIGMEIMEPLSFKGRRGSGLPGGRDGYADASLRPPGGEFEKYAYTYRLFGRLLYNPESDPETWQRYLRHEFGAASAAVERALSQASTLLPLVTDAYHPSAANNRYWPEIYTNMPIVDHERPHPYRDTLEPRRFGTVSPADPELYARVDDFAHEVVSGKRSGRYSPLQVAAWLDARATAAEDALVEAQRLVTDTQAVPFRRLAIDVRIQIALGRFFAAKFRAGVAWALYYKATAEPGRLQEALEQYRVARDQWNVAIQHGSVYRDDITVGGESWLRGHWTDRLAAIEADLNDMEAAWSRVGSSAAAAIPALADLDPAPPAVECAHEPLAAFVPGEPVTVRLQVAGGPVRGVSLRYRHVNNAERYIAAEMVQVAGGYEATIPAAYTDSPYPLMYHFELRAADGVAWYWPDLGDDLADQPYMVVRHQRT